MVWGLPRCVWARESTAPAQGNQSLSRELRASALCPGLEARFPARRREERGCGPVTGKDRASCQSGGAPALRPGAIAQSPGREAALAWASLAQRSPASSVLHVAFFFHDYKILFHLMAFASTAPSTWREVQVFL